MRFASFLPLLRRKAARVRASTMKLDLTPHWIVFMLCISILTGALAFTSIESKLQLIRVPLPGVCLFHNLTGVPCPGCGLTRSIVAAVHGDLARSFSYHRMGLIVLVYIMLQFVFRLGWIVSPPIRAHLKGWERYLNRGVIFLGIGFGLNWIFTLLLL
jgi:hypothetical protein